jgi:hypothetical protein
MLLLEFQMTGTAHSPGYKQCKDSLEEGDLLAFERDPHNAYDSAAIKILYGSMQIGWVPKRLGEAKAMLDRLLEDGTFHIEPFVASHEPENPTDMQLTVAVILNHEVPE